MIVLKLLLYPFALIYSGVMRVRNHLYDIGHKPSFDFETTIISVGNLNVGGSGKTPMTEYLIRLLSDKFPTVTLSRGYKRETAGFRMATGNDTAKTIGDEPFQMFRKFGNRVHVAVGEDRVFAIPHILHEFPETQALILDDGYQQRSIRPSLNILLTRFEHPFYDDFILPYGRLREPRSCAARAHVIVVTKCPEGTTDEEQLKIEKGIQKFANGKPVFFTRVEYGQPIPVRKEHALTEKVVLVTGIASADQLKEYCDSNFKLVRHFRFADHHRYSEADLREIELACKSQEAVVVLTTEKDMAKLECPEFTGFLERNAWFSLPIRQVFLKDGSKFDALVLDAVKAATKP